MDFMVPKTFPQNDFLEFGKLASAFFPSLLSDDNLNDPHKKLSHFQMAWLAVRYRYRACSEYNEEFKRVFAAAMESDLFREWSEGEEHHYALNKCLYGFFTNALSVFDNIGFCLYFLATMINPSRFPSVSDPKRINIKATRDAFQNLVIQLTPPISARH